MEQGGLWDEVVAVAKKIGFPVLARPSYVLGGRAMEIVYSKEQLIDYIARSADVTAGHPILSMNSWKMPLNLMWMHFPMGKRAYWWGYAAY
ncbi:MAG: hypothetical protein Ct9H300mP29_6180 [Candidatus Neomarinimicrobiota bacterium]|nr:MAG: hypothetical protein Ct9H300mP29_6180 [Candidatus Neomarinimicrobiota bacterium]